MSKVKDKQELTYSTSSLAVCTELLPRSSAWALPRQINSFLSSERYTRRYEKAHAYPQFCKPQNYEQDTTSVFLFHRRNKPPYTYLHAGSSSLEVSAFVSPLSTLEVYSLRQYLNASA